MPESSFTLGERRFEVLLTAVFFLADEREEVDEDDFLYDDDDFLTAINKKKHSRGNRGKPDCVNNNGNP